MGEDLGGGGGGSDRTGLGEEEVEEGSEDGKKGTIGVGIGGNDPVDSEEERLGLRDEGVESFTYRTAPD